MILRGYLFYYKNDADLNKIAQSSPCKSIAYEAFDSIIKDNKTYLITEKGAKIPLEIFGEHNLSNLKAAYYVCREIGISDEEFFTSIQTFKGAAKRLANPFSNGK